MFNLVCTDVPDCTAKPCAAVVDHKYVVTQVKFKIPEIATREREVWHFSDAVWVRMQSSIEEASLGIFVGNLCFGSNTATY